MMNFVGDGRDDDSLDHLMGIALEELAVLERAWLGLVGIDHQIGRPGRGEKAPLEAG
jgi:hypothetical protein